MDESQANGPAAFYLAGSVDGSRPGVFYVNTFKFSSQPKYEMISLSMHEAENSTPDMRCYCREAFRA